MLGQGGRDHIHASGGGYTTQEVKHPHIHETRPVDEQDGPEDG